MTILRSAAPVLASFGALLFTTSAFAFAPQRTALDDSRLHLLSGVELRLERRTVDQAPASSAAYARFLGKYEGWRGLWDADTHVPARLSGKGASVPGSSHSPEGAEAAARDFLAAWIDLLAPGSKPSDFTLESNVLSGGVRSIGFWQWKDGLRVEGGQLSFRFKKDRLLVVAGEARPSGQAAPVSGGIAVDASAVRDRAVD